MDAQRDTGQGTAPEYSINAELQTVQMQLVSRGNAAFKAKRFSDAINHYTQALALHTTDHRALSNRSAAKLANGYLAEALQDAQSVVQLVPEWAKGWYRLGCALAALRSWRKAAEALERGCSLAAHDTKEFESKLAVVRQQLEEERRAVRAQAEVSRTDLAWALRTARQADQQAELLAQIQQSIGAPEWEPEDWGWRPIYLPAMSMPGYVPTAGPGTGGGSEAHEVVALRGRLTVYLNGLAELDAPRTTLAAARDADALGVFERAIRSVMVEKPGAHVLTLERTPALIALLAAAAGARAVTCSLPSRHVYRQAHQLLSTNAKPEVQAEDPATCPRSSVAHPHADTLHAVREARDGPLGSNRAPDPVPPCVDDVASSSPVGEVRDPPSISPGSCSSHGPSAQQRDAERARVAARGGYRNDCEGVHGDGFRSPSHGNDGQPAGEGKQRSPRHDDRAPSMWEDARVAAESPPHLSKLPGGDERHAEVQLLPAALRNCRVRWDGGSEGCHAMQGDGDEKLGSGSRVEPGENCPLGLAEVIHLAERADVLVVDLFDHGVLGAGLLDALRHTARHLLAPGAVVLPSRVHVHAVLLDTCVGEVEGFDLSPLDRYHWHPHIAACELRRLPHRALSNPFLAATLDLQAYVEAEQAGSCLAHQRGGLAIGQTDSGDGCGNKPVPSPCQSDGLVTGQTDTCDNRAAEPMVLQSRDVTIPVTGSGMATAVAFWFCLEMPGGSEPLITSFPNLGVAETRPRSGTGSVYAGSAAHNTAAAAAQPAGIKPLVAPISPHDAGVSCEGLPTGGKRAGCALDGTAATAAGAMPPPLTELGDGAAHTGGDKRGNAADATAHSGGPEQDTNLRRSVASKLTDCRHAVCADLDATGGDSNDAAKPATQASPPPERSHLAATSCNVAEGAAAEPATQASRPSMRGHPGATSCNAAAGAAAEPATQASPPPVHGHVGATSPAMQASQPSVRDHVGAGAAAEPATQASPPPMQGHVGASSYQQALQYLEGRPLVLGTQVTVRVQIEGDRLHFTLLPDVAPTLQATPDDKGRNGLEAAQGASGDSWEGTRDGHQATGGQLGSSGGALVGVRGEGRLCGATLGGVERMRTAALPRWHFSMLADAVRNRAYDTAIRASVRHLKASGHDEVHALDMGTGSGLLAMMAARAGAEHVYAVESCGHLADAAELAVCLNGYASRCSVVHKDGRLVSARPRPDRRQPELPRPADLMVFEVFDCGLIGEGALHLLAAAKDACLAEGATIVPARATVFCQPIQLNWLGEHSSSTTGHKIQLEGLNHWQWRPDYEELHLSDLPASCWHALADPVRVFQFDFQGSTPQELLEPAQCQLLVPASASGTLNAVAFWFELELGPAGPVLSTSPYHPHGPTWQQAVQWLQPCTITTGESIQLMASHDTYSIAFKDQDADAQRLVPAQAHTSSSPRPMHSQCDAMWLRQHSELAAFHAAMAKAAGSDPHQRRRLAAAAMPLACRPGDHRVDARQAARFLLTLMS